MCECWGRAGHSQGAHQIRAVSLVQQKKHFKAVLLDFRGGTVLKNPPANAGDTGSSPGPGRSHMPRSN